MTTNLTLAKMQSGTFDEVLGLEEQFYHDGLQQGMADGVRAGQIEGRTFGLEKGFEKYIESGRLFGKSLVWANRIPRSQQQHDDQDATHHEAVSRTSPAALNQQDSSTMTLPSLPKSQRLERHLKVLHALSESETLSTENTEEAVSEFDDRLKRAEGKAKVIERLVGEGREDTETNIDEHVHNTSTKD
jgi:Essential protein Yae1, N terminal